MSSEKLALRAEKRIETGRTLTALRRAGFVPGIVYGHNVSNVMVKVNEKQFKHVFQEGGENTLVDLSIEGEERPFAVLIQEVALDPVKSTPLHVDFFAVNLKEKVRADVPLVTIGESLAVKELEGTLVQPMHSLEVESLPANIPHEIEVDVSSLKTFEDHISVKDLIIPNDVEIFADADDIVVSVQEPRSQEELEELEEEVSEDISAVEGVADADEEGEEGEEGKEKEGEGGDSGKEEKKEKEEE